MSHQDRQGNPPEKLGRPATEHPSRHGVLRGCVALAIGLLGATAAADPAPSAPARADDTAYLIPHPADTRWWLSGQLNVIAQYHPAFHAAYSGPNSLSPSAEHAISLVATVYSGLRLTDTMELLVDLEAAGGGGISSALGLAGFTNLDVVRNPTLGSAPYLARAIFHQVIPLSDEWVEVERGPLRALSRLPARRIEFRAGKLSTVDFFDVNSAGSDSHLQFMNWTIDNNGAYDYAADTRGYTLGAELEYQDRAWGVRLGEMLMPTVANGLSYDADVLHARGESLELEVRHSVLPGRAGTVRLLGYLNHARMGSYEEAISAFRAGQDPVPDIEAHRQRGRTKAGFGLNLEQELTEVLGAFGRAGWNDGANESFAYTEVDNTFELGLNLSGAPWRRDTDKLGLAVVSNGLSSAHRTYLALGGHGFLLGDGALSYGRELILKAYYTLHLWRGVFPAADVQFIENPGYNHDRGPVLVASLRLHMDL